MNAIKQYIKDKNWQEILNYNKTLNAQERVEMIAYLHTLDLDIDLMGVSADQVKHQLQPDFYTNRLAIETTLNYAFITCTRTIQELKLTSNNKNGWVQNPLWQYLNFSVFGAGPLLELYKLFPPAYLNQTIREASKARFQHFNFTILWDLYTHGLISFEEEFFVRVFFTIPMFKRNTQKDADFLWQHPEVLTNVFLQFYKYEVPVLDTSKWDTRNGSVCKRVTEFWTEVFQLLLEKGYVFNRLLIQQLMESLLNNWKKPHLDWHIRLLELLKTTTAEYLSYQNILFALLNTGSMSLINFAVKQIHSLYKAENFDAAGFIANIPAIFSKEKGEKSILISLEILDYLLSKLDYKDNGIAGHLSLLLIQPDIKIQEKTALMLVKYTDKELLKEIALPYLTNLKNKPKTILDLNTISAVINPEIHNHESKIHNHEPKIDNQESEIDNQEPKIHNHESEIDNHEPKIGNQESEAEHPRLEEDILLVPVHIPSTWEELLFQVGACIRTKSALDIDLFFEGLNQLQDIIPSGFEKQLKPYGKQLFNKFWGNEVMTCFTEFMDYWINKKTIGNQQSEVLPFLKHKCLWMQQKLASHSLASDSLPSGSSVSNPKVAFLSTPTHAPFYIHPKILIERLLQYETQNIKVEPEDLIVACNRMLYSSVDEECIHLAKTLKGNYAAAIHYALDMTDQAKPTEDLLPLWAQVARIKHPAATLNIFGNTSAKEYPAVCTPFKLGFSVEIDKNEYATWYRLALEDNWNAAWFYKKRTTSYPPLFYNLAPCKAGYREEIPYQMSLTPQYLGALLCRYIPDTSSGNEVAELEDCLYPLQFLLDHQLKIYDGGWLYIAVCLVFEKKISRALASDYIQFSILDKQQDLTLLAEIIGKLIALNFSPVNRLIEYFDKPVDAIKIKEFQLLILASCIQHFDAGRLPANSKKIITYYLDWSKSLNKEIDTDTLAKLKSK